MLTCGMMFFSTESWNKGGGGKSTARNKNGDTAVLESVIILTQIGITESLFDYSPRSISNLGFSFCPESGRTRTCWVSTLTSPWNARKMMPFHAIESYWIKIEKGRALESLFFVPPKSLWSRLSNQPRNSTGSPCSSRRNFPALLRFTSWRNSCGLTWLLNKRGFQIFLASPAKRFSSSDSFPWKFESKR